MARDMGLTVIRRSLPGFLFGFPIGSPAGAPHTAENNRRLGR
jgi:hypothetical protein